MGPRKDLWVPYLLRASRLLLRAFRVLLGARLLLNTRCRLFDLLHCRWVLKWWRWASPVLVQVLECEACLDRDHLWAFSLITT